MRAEEAAAIVSTIHRPAVAATTVRPPVPGTTAAPDPLFEVRWDEYGLVVSFDKTNGRYFDRSLRFPRLRDSQQAGALDRYVGIAQRVMGLNPNDNRITNLLRLRNVQEVPALYSKAFVTAMVERHGSITVVCYHPVTRENIASFLAEKHPSVWALIDQVPDWGRRVCTALVAIQAELEELYTS